MNEASQTPQPQPQAFDPIQFTVSRPLASPNELAVAFGQLIDGIADISGRSIERIITPGLSAITISWLGRSVPSDEWLGDVESQLRSFAACTGVEVHFRRR